jgi:spore germination cell wall hydrolase CwlJ-like protein
MKTLAATLVLLALSGCAPAMAGDDEVLRVAMTIFAEAKGESLQGKRAVASVIWNRAGDAVTSHRYGWSKALNRVCRAPAFSCWAHGWPKAPRMGKPQEARAWYASYELARQIENKTFAPDLDARHYAERRLRNYWTRTMVVMQTVGNHKFYE